MIYYDSENIIIGKDAFKSKTHILYQIILQN